MTMLFGRSTGTRDRQFPPATMESNPEEVLDLEILDSKLAERRRSSRYRTITSLGLQLTFIALVLGSWQIVADKRWINPLFSSKPSAVAVSLYDLFAQGTIFHPLGVTMIETAIGFALSVSIGVGVALLLLEVPLLYRAASPFITAMNNAPRIALSPIFVLWFGIGSTGRVAFIFTIVFFVILISSYAGLKNGNRDVLLLAKVLGASRWQTFVRFRLASALPTIFAALQLGLAYSFLGAVISEMFSGGSGLGAMLTIDAATYKTGNTFALIILMACIGTLLTLGLKTIERNVLSWQRYELRGV